MSNKILTPEQKANALASIHTSAGMQVIFDIMEAICIETENELIGEVPWGPKVPSLQAIAYAQRAMLNKTTSTVDLMVKDRPQAPVPIIPKTSLERAEEEATMDIGPGESL